MRPTRKCSHWRRGRGCGLGCTTYPRPDGPFRTPAQGARAEALDFGSAEGRFSAACIAGPHARLRGWIAEALSPRSAATPVARQPATQANRSRTLQFRAAARASAPRSDDFFPLLVPFFPLLSLCFYLFPLLFPFPFAFPLARPSCLWVAWSVGLSRLMLPWSRGWRAAPSTSCSRPTPTAPSPRAASRRAARAAREPAEP